MTFEQDYLAFGSILKPMLQESSSSKGPRVPRSIHSTSDFDKSQYTTLMRITFDHEHQKFSDLDVRISGSRDLGYLGSQVSSDEWPVVVALAFNCVSTNISLSTRARA